MGDRIVMWASKSPEAQALPPFCASLEWGDMRLTLDGRSRPESIKLQVENIPFGDGMLNFFKKFGSEEDGELVFDADRVTVTDFLPFALQNYCELLLKSTEKENTDEIPNVDHASGYDKHHLDPEEMTPE